ncbi:MAG TPA: FAD-dependent oxidoreductase [Solirubrobacteraceae bacterium]|nr:FAD-dependent oxidoreductase [Solirubrobacteraceae bacterium]
MRLVVVGASLAGLRAAQAARAAGFEGKLTVVGDESHLPYTRPPLSKELLCGVQTPEQCALPHGSLDVQWRLGAAATGLDRAAHQVLLADGERIGYDRLVIATGCRARTWPGPELEGVVTLRDLDDALALRASLTSGARLLIVGAGFIGCEVAASARKRDVEVTVVDIAGQPMLPLGAELGARCARLHEEHGVDLRLGTGVSRLDLPQVELTDGTKLEADVVLMALGAIPNTEWLRDSGLELNPGVVCDATLTTTADPDVLAAGDLVSWPHPLARGELVRVEHWTVAAEHGQLAGRNALLARAERMPHDPPPYFWSDQYDVKIQAVGFPTAAERLEILELSPDGDRLVAVGAQDGQLVGVIAFNAAKRLAWYRRQLAGGPARMDQIRELVTADAGALGPPPVEVAG